MFRCFIYLYYIFCYIYIYVLFYIFWEPHCLFRGPHSLYFSCSKSVSVVLYASHFALLASSCVCKGSHYRLGRVFSWWASTNAKHTKCFSEKHMFLNVNHIVFLTNTCPRKCCQVKRSIYIYIYVTVYIYIYIPMWTCAYTCAWRSELKWPQVKWSREHLRTPITKT